MFHSWFVTYHENACKVVQAVNGVLVEVDSAESYGDACAVNCHVQTAELLLGRRQRTADVTLRRHLLSHHHVTHITSLGSNIQGHVI